jgi:3-ketosteroid 9alpha-monooxygenase subunit B
MHKPGPFEVTIQKVIPETATTVSLQFDVHGEVPPFQAGQFLSINPHQFKGLSAHLAFLEELKGRKEPVRAYSLASAPHEPLAITIKEDFFIPKVSKHAPLLSPFLVYSSAVGSRIQVLGFSGRYVLPHDIEERADHLVHLVAGSGVVPNWSILKHALRVHPGLRHVFVYANKTWDDVIFRDPLNALAAANPDRLRVVHTLTRQVDFLGLPPGVRSGRISAALLEEVAPDPARSFAYVCGPAIPPWTRRAALESGVPAEPRFLEAAIAILKGLGFTPERVKRESWG